MSNAVRGLLGAVSARVRVAWCSGLVAAVTVVGSPARAGEVDYSTVDLATVRIFAMSGIDTADVVHTATQRKFTLAVPAAGHGSGLRVTADGLILTARHVVEGARHLVVRSPKSKKALPATVVYMDDRLDFALVSVGGDDGAFLPLPAAAPSVKVRQTVFAVGYPLDPSQLRPQSTRGVIGGTAERGTYSLGISVNPGNSGGPLVDENEHVLGTIVARGDPSKGVQGMGYAVPLDRVLAVLPSVKERHARAHAALRAAPEAVLAEARAIGGLIEGEGVIRMLDDAKRGLKKMEQSAFATSLKEALDAGTPDADLLVIACAFQWNSAVMRRVLDEEGAGVAVAKARLYCKSALAADADVVKRSPFVKHVIAAEGHQLELPGGAPTERRRASTVPPTGAAGFTLGSSVESATKVCEDAKLKMSGVKKEGLRCSGTPVDASSASVVRLKFCADHVCRIDVIQKLEGDDPSTWLSAFDAQQKALEATHGPPSRSSRVVPPECSESISWCLSNDMARVDASWSWSPAEPSVSVTLDRVDGRGVIRVSTLGR